MKIRNGYVSNSSSSSFVILKDSLNNEQIDKILNYIDWIDFFIKNKSNLEFNISPFNEADFMYYETDPWQIKEYKDLIFGETSMDNFDMYYYLQYIDVDLNYVDWDEGYIDDPTKEQRNFIKQMKIKLREQKINKIEGK